MKTLTIVILVCTAILLVLTSASKAMGSIGISEKGRICGRIVDFTTGNPLVSVSVDLLTSDGLKLVVGTLTNNKGEFTLTMLEPGNYILDISLDGYNNYRVYNVTVKNNVVKNEIGDIKLQKKINKTARITSRSKQVVKESAVALID
jgi:5-hydroxyisourate hydrolase-like protein (transthyretin family)